MSTTVPNDIAAASAEFDRLTSRSNQVVARVKARLFGWLYLLLPLSVVVPGFIGRRKAYVFSYDQVRSVLSNADAFATPFRETMAYLDRAGAISLLGFEGKDDATGKWIMRDTEYQQNLCQIMRSLPLEDLPQLAKDTAAQAESIVRGADELDVMGELLIRIVLDFAQRCFGFKFSCPRRFHRWTMAISNYTFSGSKPSDSLRTAAEPAGKLAAEAAGKLMDREVDGAIAEARAGRCERETVLGRLTSMGSLSDASASNDNKIRATVAGLLSGMLPNVPIAGFNVLQVLLHNPNAMAIARKAAMDNDDGLLERCIMEALRFRPIDLGRRRICIAQDRSILGLSAWRRTPIPIGHRVFAVTLTAMFDWRRVRKPFRFDPSRPPSDNLALGAGKHWCVGAPIALCLLTHTLKPLLCKTGLRQRPGAPPPTFFLGFFPESFTLQLDERAT